MAALPSRVARLVAVLLACWWGASLQARPPQDRPPIPRRIVSLVPAATEMLFAMGAGDRVVGVGSYDHFPPEVETRTRLGGLIDPNIEVLLTLRPDLVIAYDTQTDLRARLARAAIPTFRYVHRGLPDITDTIRALGARVGSERAAEALASGIEDRLETIRARVSGQPRPSTLLVMGREAGSLRQIVASGGYGFLHDMLVAAGGADAVADIVRENVQVSTEMLLERGPDVIIELHYGSELSRAQLGQERTVWNRLPAVPAVRTGRVYLLEGNDLVVPGPRVADAVERFARVLHPDAFR